MKVPALLTSRIFSAAFFSVLLLAASCSEQSSFINHSFNDDIIKYKLHDEGIVSFYEVSADSKIISPSSGISWNILELDGENRFRAINRPRLTNDENLYIPAENNSVYYISLNAETDKGIDISSPFIKLDGLPIKNKNPEKVFITMDEPGQVIAVKGYPSEIKSPGTDTPYEFVSMYSGIYFFRLLSPGYFELKTGTESINPQSYNIFVSPVKSVHTDRADLDWYFTQFRTSTTSNCGPTVVSMGIAWASGEVFPVSSVRAALGWNGSGAVTYEEMMAVLSEKGIKSETIDYETPQQIFRLIDQDKLVGVSYNMAGISYQEKPDENLFDQYYIDRGGHYLAIKGYSFDEKYFIIYDPIPSDWQENSERYSDGMSMYGRNRYYLVDELVNSMLKQQILVIHRDQSDYQ